MEINQQYKVVYGEENGGTLLLELMTLIKIEDYKGERDYKGKIFTFRDSMGMYLKTYEHNENIDWEFIEELNF